MSDLVSPYHSIERQNYARRKLPIVPCTRVVMRVITFLMILLGHFKHAFNLGSTIVGNIHQLRKLPGYQ